MTMIFVVTLILTLHSPPRFALAPSGRMAQAVRMKSATATLSFVALCLSPFLNCSLAAETDGFVPLFDGKSLKGWSAPDMSYWSVEDGAITARSTEEKPCKYNQFLVWQPGRVDDFELKLNFRIQGGPSANSGIQIRSEVEPDGHVKGYQADIDRAGKWCGALYDEKGRRLLAGRGQEGTIRPDGREKNSIADPDELLARLDFDGWNAYHIIARGNTIELKINGSTTARVIDEDPANRELDGILALQLHSGPPMTIQFKDILLKRLPLTDNRKKIVLVAGRPSHRSGDHEHNAGIKLLAKRLRALDSVIVANYHDNGWPKDPTFLDNADTLVLYMDGGGGHPALKHLEEIAAHCGDGGGLVCIHYAVEIPKGEGGEAWRKWIGGYYESGFSVNPHWTLTDVELDEHPVCQGVKPWDGHDEWYFNMRFRENMGSVTRLLQAKPDDEARSGSTTYPRGPKKHIVAASGRMETVMWAVQRQDGGRGIGFTGGHFHKGWANDQQRRLVLNGILWSSGHEVPKGGVMSEPVSEDEINANLDKKNRMRRIKLSGVQGAEAPTFCAMCRAKH